MPAPDSAKLTRIILLELCREEMTGLVGFAGRVANLAADKAYPLGVEEGRKLERTDIVVWLREQSDTSTEITGCYAIVAGLLAEQLEARE